VEGEAIRKVYDLELRRSRSSVFSLTWLAVHPITPKSPLHGLDAAALQRSGLTIMVSVSGLDEHLGATVHARHAYAPADLVVGARFLDILEVQPDGSAVVDYRRFHEVAPIAPVPPRPPPPGEGSARNP
jgi:inward rectifier potassium channel